MPWSLYMRDVTVKPNRRLSECKKGGEEGVQARSRKQGHRHGTCSLQTDRPKDKNMTEEQQEILVFSSFPAD